MAKIGRNLVELAQEVERRANAKKDFIAPVSKMRADASHGLLALELGGEEHQIYPVGDIAHGQIAEFTGIPMAYYTRMAEHDPKLLATNINRWFDDKKHERRTLRTLDGNARAFLSDKYRPLENEDLFNAVLPVLAEMDVMIVSAELTERRMYIKAVDNSIARDVPKGRVMGDGSHVFFDTVSPAITFSNSEVGQGALAIETGVYTKVCTNLAMIGTNLRKYHTGARASVSDDVYALLSDKTKQVTDEATWRQVRDLVRGAFDLAKFDAMIKRLGQATEDKIDSDPIQVIERTAKRWAFSGDEKTSVLRHLIEGGDLSRYGLHSAITRAAQDLPDYDRATQFERIGGDVIELSRNDWREHIAVAA